MLNYNEYTSCLEILDCISPVAKSASLVVAAVTRSGDDGASPLPHSQPAPFTLFPSSYIQPSLLSHLQSGNVFPRSRFAFRQLFHFVEPKNQTILLFSFRVLYIYSGGLCVIASMWFREKPVGSIVPCARNLICTIWRRQSSCCYRRRRS